MNQSNKTTGNQNQSEIAEFEEAMRFLKAIRIPGEKALPVLLQLVELTELDSTEAAEILIINNLSIIEATRSIDSAVLLGKMAYYACLSKSLPEAEHYADKALLLARDIKSDVGEATALIAKASISVVRGHHKLAMSFYTMALNKCSKAQKPEILCQMGDVYCAHSEYDKAFECLQTALQLSTKILRSKSLNPFIKQRLIATKANIFCGIVKIHDSIGDDDGAIRTLTQAFEFAYKNEYSSKLINILLVQKPDICKPSDDAAYYDQCMTDAHTKRLDPMTESFLYKSCLARDYIKSSRFGDALDIYEDILYGTRTGVREIGDDMAFKFLKEQTDFFAKIVCGILECLVGLQKPILANDLDNEFNKYKIILNESGITEPTRQTKLSIQIKAVFAALERIFQNRPNNAQYEDADISAIYDQDKQEATATKGGKKISLTKREFLTFKFYADNKGKYVSRKELHEYWMKHGESLDSVDCISEAIRRGLKEKLKLDSFFEGGKGPKRTSRLVDTKRKVLPTRIK